MTTPANLIATYGTNQWLIESQTAGLTHADSVRQPQPRGNCMNWVLGHILGSRNSGLKAVGETPVQAEAVRRWYVTGSAPISAPDQGLPLPELLAALGKANERMTQALAGLTPKDLNAIHDEETQTTVGGRIAGLQWHETYHVGQLELLRQLAGTDDAIV